MFLSFSSSSPSCEWNLQHSRSDREFTSGNGCSFFGNRRAPGQRITPWNPAGSQRKKRSRTTRNPKLEFVNFISIRKSDFCSGFRLNRMEHHTRCHGHGCHVGVGESRVWEISQQDGFSTHGRNALLSVSLHAYAECARVESRLPSILRICS